MVEKGEWYQKNWVIALLGFIFAPAGILLAWINPYYSKRTKWLTTSILALWFVLVLVSSSNQDIKPPDISTPKTQTKQVKPKAVKQKSAKPKTKKKPDTFAKVVEVIDGDTIKVNIKGVIYKVRYIGIDTPETKHPSKGVEYYGAEASAYNEKLVDGKTVRLIRDVSETDKYGRLLRYIYVGDLFVNAKLVKGGYANASTYPPDVKFADKFKELERWARENSKGLWGEPEEVEPEPEVQEPSTSSSFVGNRNSGKLHNLAHGNCQNYVNMMNEGNKVFFNSEQAGIDQGFYPCLKC